MVRKWKIHVLAFLTIYFDRNWTYSFQTTKLLILLSLLKFLKSAEARRGGGGKDGPDYSNASAEEKILVVCIVCGFFVSLLLGYCIWWKCKCCKKREEEQVDVENEK